MWIFPSLSFISIKIEGSSTRFKALLKEKRVFLLKDFAVKHSKSENLPFQHHYIFMYDVGIFCEWKLYVALEPWISKETCDNPKEIRSVGHSVLTVPCWNCHIYSPSEAVQLWQAILVCKCNCFHCWSSADNAKQCHTVAKGLFKRKQHVACNIVQHCCMQHVAFVWTGLKH